MKSKTKKKIIIVLLAYIVIALLSSLSLICYKKSMPDEQDIIKTENSSVSIKYNDTLEALIETYLKQNSISKEDVSIYISSVDGEISCALNEEKYFVAASLYKIPLAMIYYEKIANNEMNIEDYLLYKSEHFEEGGPIGAYYVPGDQITLKELLHSIIMYSDNTAGHILYENLGGWLEYKKMIQRYSSSTNYDDRYHSYENITNSIYMNDVLGYLYDHRQIFSSLITDMKSSMPHDYLNRNKNLDIAQKYGSYGQALNAIGLYYDNEIAYKIVILTDLGVDAEKYIGDLSELCYDFFKNNTETDKELVTKPNENNTETDKELMTKPNEKNTDVEYPSLEYKKINMEQSIQENNYFCVPACVQMVLRLHGIIVSQSEVALEMNTVPVTGTEYVDLARVVNKYVFHNENPSQSEPGYRVQTIDRFENDEAVFALFEERVKTDIKSGDPVFVAIDVQALYPDLNSGNHMILVTGYAAYEGTDIIEYYYIVDPSYVIQDPVYGGLKTVTREELINALVVNVEPAYIW